MLSTSNQVAGIRMGPRRSDLRERVGLQAQSVGNAPRHHTARVAAQYLELRFLAIALEA
jgi:hypothetical protein